MNESHHQGTSVIDAKKSNLNGAALYRFLSLTNLAGLTYFIISGPKRITCLLVCTGLSVFCLLSDLAAIRMLKHFQLLFLFTLFSFALPFILPGSEWGRVLCWTMPIYVFFAIVGAVAMVRCVQAESESWIKWSLLCFVLFLCIWGFLFVSRVENIGSSTSDFQTAEEGDSTSLFGLFLYGNAGYSITYFIVIPIAASPILILAGVNPFTILLLLSGGIGMIEATMQGRRGPILIFGISAAILFILTILYNKRDRNPFPPIAILACGGLLFLTMKNNLQFADCFSATGDRFLEISEDSRFNIWKDAVYQLLKNPLGGTSLNSESIYAHNAILDFGLIYGFPGFFCMLGLFAYAAQKTLKALPVLDESKSPLPIFLFLLVVSHAALMMTEPIIPERLLVFLFFLACLTLLTGNPPIAQRYAHQKPKRSDIWPSNNTHLRSSGFARL